MLKKILPLFLLAVLLTSCGNDFIFEKNIDIAESGWRYDQPLIFDFIIEDSTAKYDILLDVEHAGDYRFQNLYAQFHTSFPSGKKDSQIVSLELAAQNGIWNGECSGNTCTVQIPLQVKAIFPEIGKHQISMEQYMRKNPLLGVQAMTLKVREVKEKS